MTAPTEAPASADRAPSAPVAEAGAATRLTLRQRLSKLDVRLSPYLYVLPFFAVFFVVGLYPMLYSGYLSFFSWPHFAAAHGPGVGWDNYLHVLRDPVFHHALRNTIAIFLLSSIPQIVVATVVAALLDTALHGRTWWRMGVLLPFVVAPAATALIFGSLFADQSGLINDVLHGIGLPGVHWHSNRPGSWLAIATMVDWRWTGYNALILLAAMQAVPGDLYESAALDGAGRVKQFLYVTLPGIRPTMLFVIVTSTIGALHLFTEPRLFDNDVNHQGGSNYEYQTLTMYVFNTANSTTDPYPRAAAATWIEVLLVIAVSLLSFGLTYAAQRKASR